MFRGRLGAFIDMSNYRKRVQHKLAAELKIARKAMELLSARP